MHNIEKQTIMERFIKKISKAVEFISIEKLQLFVISIIRKNF